MTREEGNAVVEMAILGTLVFGVLVHVLVLFGALQRATLATSAAAREFGRAVVVADGEAEGARRGAISVAMVERGHGLPSGSLTATVSGFRHRGAIVVVRVQTSVAVVRIPFLGAVVPGLAVPVEATHAVRIDRYRSGS
jgi:hypothetical protein